MWAFGEKKMWIHKSEFSLENKQQNLAYKSWLLNIL